MLLVISGPSSVGKSRVIRALLRQHRRYSFVLSHTSRKQRQDEQNGKDYLFVSEKDFQAMYQSGLFLQWKTGPFGSYGTSFAQLDAANQGEQVPVLDLDSDGYAKLKGYFQEVLGIFLLPPNHAVLWERIANRGASRGILSLEDALVRYHCSCAGAEYAMCYDYILVNRDDTSTACQIHGIVQTALLQAQKSSLFQDWLEDGVKSMVECGES